MADIFNFTDVWNAVGTVFKSIGLAVTNTASAAGSNAVDVRVTGATTGSFAVAKDGKVGISSNTAYTAPAVPFHVSTADGVVFAFDGAVGAGTGMYGVWRTNTNDRGYIGTADLLLAAGSVNDFCIRAVAETAFSVGTAEKARVKATSLKLSIPLETFGYTVAGLPSGVIGMRAYVTDANATFTAGIGAIVAAGGANKVPVFYDGTNWRIG